MAVTYSEISVLIHETLRQLTFVGALLSGFSFTSVIALIVIECKNQPALKRTIVGFYIAIAGLLLTTLFASFGQVILARGSEIFGYVSNDNEKLQYVEILLEVCFSSFYLGILGLLFGVGNSGYIKSIRLGHFSAWLSFLAFIIFILVITQLR